VVTFNALATTGLRTGWHINVRQMTIKVLSVIIWENSYLKNCNDKAGIKCETLDNRSGPEPYIASNIEIGCGKVLE
jgi:hypothetical protein